MRYESGMALGWVKKGPKEGIRGMTVIYNIYCNVSKSEYKSPEVLLSKE